MAMVGGCAFILVASCIDGTISLTLDGQIVRLRSCARIFKLLFGFNPVRGDSLITFQIYYLGYLGWIGGTISLTLDEQPVRLYFFVLDLEGFLFRFDPVWGHNITLIHCHNILQRRWSACVYVGWIDGTIILALDEQAVRLYSCVLTLKVLFGFDPVWSHNLTPILFCCCCCCCQNALRWRCLTCAYLGWIDGTILLVLDAQLVRLCSPVLRFGDVIGIRSTVRSWSHKISLSKCSALATIALRSSWLNRCDDFIGYGRTDCTFMFACAGLWWCFGDLTQCEVMISWFHPDFRTKTCHTADDRSTFILVAPMARYRLPLTSRTYVRILVGVLSGVRS